ncbi:hypothetical protein [uncultured Treponema sp.]|uniref:hypothetical protein n=1 Tax=uncultured Treponema sp. TaxID=162155 RepID=UPI0027D9C9A9|nr:hypothetical protein [uncultured Treponema sp.]
MKGKKIFRNCIGALALLLGLAGCQNSLEGDSVSGGGIEGLRTLTVEIKNYSEFVEESSVQANRFASARSIMPDAFTSDDTLHYYLYGKASNGETKEWTEVTVTGGKFTLDVEPYNWNLTLAVTADATTTIEGADKLSDVKGKAVLIGYAAVDLTRQANIAKFTLKPDGLTTLGQVVLKTSLEGNWTIPDSINSVRLGIYNLTNGKEVTYSDDSKTVVSVARTDFSKTFGDGKVPGKFGESGKKLTPGTYTFKVEFLNAKDECEAEWSDSLVILPGKTNDKPVAVPNVIGTAPAAATDFTASYVDGTKDITPGFYDVKFEWKGDACINERSFEIDLLEVTGTKTVTAIPISDTEWATAETDSGNKVVTYKSEVISDQLYVEGSLLANNTSLTMKLPLGKAYVARIRAVNRAGSSDNAYVTVGTGKGTEKVFEGTFINLFRIRYNLQGGTYTPATGTEQTGTPQTAPIVDYASKEIPYLVPATNTLVKNNIAWTKWQKADNTYVDTTATPNYSGPENIDLRACYTTDADVNIFDAAKYKLDATWITVGKAPATPLTGTESCTVTVSKAAALNTDGDLTWTITVADSGAEPITGTFAYDSVKIEVSAAGINRYTQIKADVAVGTPATFTQTGAKLLESGTYNVMITATEGTTTVTLPVVLTITD